eukprot:GGOE01059592.1.p1 GENE.GGOE01059592.1~~GGOE01059592.1.p1  ORF type:complete len:127 (+),score=38.61 GGOE01059592.1:27-383(+)
MSEFNEFLALRRPNQSSRPARPPLRPIAALRLAIPYPKASSDVEAKVLLGLLGVEPGCNMAKLRANFIKFSVPFAHGSLHEADMQRFLCLSMAYQNLMVTKRLQCGRKGTGTPSAMRH